MKYIFYIFFVFAISVNAQTIQLNITDYSNNLPIDDADIYFAKSTKNFVSDTNGKAIIDLSNIDLSDEIIISKKDYQDAKINVDKINSQVNIKLEKVGNIELQEAFISNLKAEDILKKVIENYDKNFNTEEHYYLVNFQQDLLLDSIDRDYIDVDLQFRFKKNNLQIKSNDKINNRIIGDELSNKQIFRLNFYFNDISLLDIIKKMHTKLSEKRYDKESVKISKYADRYMYEIEFKNYLSNVTNWFLIDKQSFVIVEHTSKQTKTEYKKENYTINYNNLSYKYRPYKNKWILKESTKNWSNNYKEKDNTIHTNIIKINLNVKDFNTQSFPSFNKSVNEKMDIRRSFK